VGWQDWEEKKVEKQDLRTPIVDPLDIQQVKMEDTSNEPSAALAEIKEITWAVTIGVIWTIPQIHKENTSVKIFMNCEM